MDKSLYAKVFKLSREIRSRTVGDGVGSGVLRGTFQTFYVFPLYFLMFKRQHNEVLIWG